MEVLRASGQTSLDPEVSFEMETKICMSVIWDCVGACHSKEIWTETKGVCTEWREKRIKVLIWVDATIPYMRKGRGPSGRAWELVAREVGETKRTFKKDVATVSNATENGKKRHLNNQCYQTSSMCCTLFLDL